VFDKEKLISAKLPRIPVWNLGTVDFREFANGILSGFQDKEAAGLMDCHTQNFLKLFPTDVYMSAKFGPVWLDLVDPGRLPYRIPSPYTRLKPVLCYQLQI